MIEKNANTRLRVHVLKQALFLSFLTFLLAGLTSVSSLSWAQETATPPRQVTQEQKTFRARARASDATFLVSGQNTIQLWGIEEAGNDALLSLKARTALDNAIGATAVECDLKDRRQALIVAQCNTANGLDLGLFMLQQGFVTVDRSQVFGSIFEGSYIQAETEAQNRRLGLWSQTSGENPDSLWITLGFVLFIVVLGGFIFLSVYIMRGFQKVIEAQNDNLEMMAKERQLRQKERGIIAAMLDTEIKSNKAKIEAYLVVYEETLKSLKDTSREPKYKTSGDIIQKQPALDRSVFDRNTDKLDALGRRIASDLIHFYARIKSKSEYVNLEPDTDYTEALQTVEEAVSNARELNDLAAQLLEEFDVRGVAEERKAA